MSDSDLSSGDPWDIAPSAPDTTSEEVTDDAGAPSVEDVPPPPPLVGVADPVDPVDDVDPIETDGVAAGVAPEFEMPELDVPELDMSEISASPIDVSEFDENHEAGSADFDGLDIPEIDTTNLEVPDLDISDIDTSDLGLGGVEMPDLDAADSDLAGIDIDDDLDLGSLGEELASFGSDTEMDVEPGASSSDAASRGPLSAMLAGTGLFGNTDDETPSDATDADEDATGSAEGTDADPAEFSLDDDEEHADSEPADSADSPPDVPDLVTPTDSPVLGGTDAELPEDGPDWLDFESPNDNETAAPPSVYKELEGLGRLDGAGEQPEPSVEDFGALYGSEEDSADETPVDHDPYGISFGAEAGDEEEGAEDEDIARVAALVADVQPVVESADAESPDEGAGSDVADLDWLDVGEEVDEGEPVTEEDGDAEGSEAEVEETIFDVGDAETDFSVPEVHFDEPADVVATTDADAGADPAPAALAADPFAEPVVSAEDEPELDAMDLIDDELDGSHESDEHDDTDSDTDVDGLALLDKDTQPRTQSSDWGSKWEQSQQGWVDGEWRPIVATTDRLAAWTVDVYLGVVTGDVLISDVTADTIATARQEAESAMVDEATARGAHAVVSVSTRVERLDGQTLVTASGTAVTLATDGAAPSA